MRKDVSGFSLLETVDFILVQNDHFAETPAVLTIENSLSFFSFIGSTQPQGVWDSRSSVLLER
jgi:hypothetical protein